MKVAGLDLSLRKTGIVIAEASAGAFTVVHEERLDTEKLRGMERLWHVVRHVVRTMRQHGVEDVAIEGYAFAKADSHAHSAGELGGVVRLSLWRAGFSWHEVAPATLKKFVTAKGNAPKEVMLREVFRRWQYDAQDNNVCDAYALARFVAGAHVGFERKSDGEAWSKVSRVLGQAGAA